MKLQVVNSETGEVIFVPSANRHIELEIHSLLKTTAPWWRPVKRRWIRDLDERFRSASAELRDLTRF